MVAISKGGLRDGGMAHMPILMTNCPRISFLDKASFILTPIVAEWLCTKVKERGGRGGVVQKVVVVEVVWENSWHYCTWMCFVWSCLSLLHVHTQHTCIPRLDLSPNSPNEDRPGCFSQHSCTLTWCTSVCMSKAGNRAK